MRKKLHQKQNSEQQNQEKLTKRIPAEVTKATNDLVGSKMADKRFLLKTQKLLPSQ